MFLSLVTKEQSMFDPNLTKEGRLAGEIFLLLLHVAVLTECFLTLSLFQSRDILTSAWFDLQRLSLMFELNHYST